jgi:hypothetical protein
MGAIPPEIREAEAGALRAAYETATDRTHARFAKDVGFSSGAMVWQYLSGHRPLNLHAAALFAQGLNIPVRSFSERLDLEFRTIARAVHGAPPVPPRHLTDRVREATRNADEWPFSTIDQRKLQQIAAQDLLRIEGAILSAASQLGLDIRHT